MTDDLFGGATALRRKSPPSKARPGRAGATGEAEYNAASIEVLEGLEPVRRRPGHVHRRHGFHRHAPPLRRGDRQRDGRGGRRPRDLHRSVARRRRVAVGRRQRPRHAGRPAPEISRQVGARNHHDQAARRRQIRLRRLRDLGRPARRRRLGGQRAVGARRGRGRARPDALPPGLRARRAGHQARGGRQGPQPPRHARALPSRRADFRQDGALRPGAAVQDDARQGLSVRRRGNSLALRARRSSTPKGRSPPRRPSISPAA